MNDDQVEQPKWDVMVGPDLPGGGAAITLHLSRDGRFEVYRLDARSATRLSNALIVEAEKAAFVAARKPTGT
jgi:hypothetical protein